MLEFHPVKQQPVAPARLAGLLREFKRVVEEHGMASIDEYGDMLNWGLPSEDGRSRSLHAFHPGFCSFSDQYYGTVHYHGGTIRGTVLAGRLEHATYRAVPAANGDRFLGDEAYRLERHLHVHEAGTAYELPAMVPHWLWPTEPTLTYFEEEDLGVMGDLVNPATDQTDAFLWEQEDAEAFLPEMTAIIDRRLAELSLFA